MSEENRKYTSHELEKAILLTLKEGGIDDKIGVGNESFIADFLEKHSIDGDWPKRRVAEAIWSLLSKGMVYLDFSLPKNIGSVDLLNAGGRWKVMLTDLGRALAKDMEYVPEDKDDYFARFVRDIPMADETVERYVREALETYRQRCYLACAVMLGVASEAVFLDMAEALAKWSGCSNNKLKKLLEGRRAPFIAVLSEVRRIFDDNVPKLDESLKDGLGEHVTSVANVVRGYRNDAGHPVGKQVSRDSCHASLFVLPAAIRRMYELRDFFLRSTADLCVERNER